MSTVEASVEVDVPITTAYNQWTQFEPVFEVCPGCFRALPRSATP